MGQTPGGNNDAPMSFISCEILLVDGFEIGAVVCEKPHAAARCVLKLGAITSAQLPGIAGGQGLEAPRRKQTTHKNTNVLVHVDFGKQTAHRFFARGSMRSSFTRLHSMNALMSS